MSVRRKLVGLVAFACPGKVGTGAAPVARAGDEERKGASSGQILVLFALFLVGLMGMLALATDLGIAFAQRRSMQNAADAGALAGARAVARWTKENPTSALGEVSTFVAANRMTTSPVIDECIYIDYANGGQGSCSAPVTPNATGVLVRVREVHPTFFIRVIPGAPRNVTVTAQATAHVERYSGFPSESPFIVCGSHSWAVFDRNGNPYPRPGADIPILRNGANPQINPDAIGVTFFVQNNQMSQGTGIKKASGCETEAARFNGITNQSANSGKESNQWFEYTEGTNAGPTRVAVNGVQGCKVGQYADCVMLLPIAVDNPSEDDAHPKQVYVVGYAAFFVTRESSNGHYGRLLEDYIVTGPSDPNWCRDCNNGVAVVRLTS